MNSYDDPSSARGRAQMPGPSDDHGPDAGDPQRRASAGRASVGRGSVGGGQGPWPGNSNGYGGASASASARPVSPAGRASVGSASVGSASVGSASVSPGAAGRASVGRASASAAVRPVSPAGQVSGRATVRPISPAGTGFPEPDMLEGPGGPKGPGRRGRGVKNLDPAAAKKAKRRKRVNIIIAGFAVLVMLAGGGVVALTWFYDDVPEYSTSEVEATSIVYAGGKTMATLGDVNRTVVPFQKISPLVRDAVKAAEDKNFEDHEGIDLKGIARAAWNNFTGGTTQGASTITQQYARHAAELTGINYNRKIREAVLARRLEQTYTKDQILGFYLNAIYFGRGCHGIEAAAKCYFGKSALAQPGQPGALTASEAAVLAAVIKQPEPDPSTGHQGYDPQNNLKDAQDRWTYTLNNMVEKGWLSQADRAAAKYPTVKKYDPKACTIGCGRDKPVGNVLNYVRDELEAMGVSEAAWKQGGYRVTTTINDKAQAAAEAAARRASKESPLNGRPNYYQAALVAIDPNNGQVLAYYGGDNGTGTDYAGLNSDGKTGPHPPGSTFKIYTLAAALREGIRIDSRWDARKDEDPDYRSADGTPRKIRNAGRDVGKIACGSSCTLEESTIQSFNTPFYWIAKGIGWEKVAKAAYDAGIRTMSDTKPGKGEAHKLTNEDLGEGNFNDPVIGFGQYPVTVLDHANGMATFAARGMYNKAHFIKKVEKRNPQTGKFEAVPGTGEKLKPVRKFEEDQMDDLNSVLQKIPPKIENRLTDGRPATGKTGTWELNQTSKGASGDAWMIGATPQVAAAVWVGSNGDRKSIQEKDGKAMGGSGTPAAIWEEFMEKVHEALKYEVKEFPDRKNTGEEDSPYPNGQKVQEPPDQDEQCRLFPFLCQDNNNGQNNGGQNDGGQNNGGQNNGGQNNGGIVLPTGSPDVGGRDDD
ncbi:transglycosylase domain-containing protein [Actinomycetes bacterium KLBMP 9797]